ncbi:MAG: polyprenyl synthetase family protein, partial [Actinomycetota bacterium]
MNPHEYLQLPTVEEDLVVLEEKLAQSVLFGDPYLDQVTTHLIYAGGKRLRPLLAVASATGGERRATDDDLMGGIALELMHLASL